MFLRILFIFLGISVLEQLCLLVGATGLQELPSVELDLEKKCSAYCFSVITPTLDKVLQQKPANHSSEELNRKVISLERTVVEVRSNLTIAEAHIKFKDDLIKEHTHNVNNISKLLEQLAIANCQNQMKELAFTKYKELTATTNKLANAAVLFNQKLNEIKVLTEILKTKDHLIMSKNRQIVQQSNKLNFMTATVSYMQKSLANAEDKIKIKDELISVKSKEINEISKALKVKDDLIAVKEKEISDKSEDELLLALGSESCPIGRPNGIYKINNPGFKALCNSSGWMTIERRYNGSLTFQQNWAAYRNGFGSLSGEFFIGLKKLRQMTKDKPHELYIKLGNSEETDGYAHYDNFQIGSEKEFYKLKSLGTFDGAPNVQDSLRYHEGMQFSTFDGYNDNNSLHCAIQYASGWWFNKCSYSSSVVKSASTIYMFGSEVIAEMLIRPRS
ncbi:angiopoietin-4 isoform X2 [Drosophila subpulchrella]|uniref:angiopoietin-4 isoform X2 n=1 Tax=Drosophila subpulchrella TaxID=1486046 RepID=UPI0018A14200|nr:angiopoietin-4 isoform X2 [Drosophila subpulchrella]